MFDRTDDTIVAISSPPGFGLRGVVRLSGPEALRLAGEVFVTHEAAALVDSRGHRRLLGRVRFAADASLPAELYVFRAPASYTRQDLVELHLSGSPPVLGMLLEALITAGARQAVPGEFTARAYFAGALDLTEVEGVSAMIHARNDAQLRASEALLHGHLSKRTAAVRAELADLLALLEAQIDFVEESIEFTSSEYVSATLERIGKELDGLLLHAPAIERLEVLPRVLLVGPPNAGKSTLFNLLVGHERAIPSAMAGTTRDVLSAPLQVPGGEVTLLDSAGISIEMGESASSPPTEPGRLAEEATRRSMASADLLLLVVDVTMHNAVDAHRWRVAWPSRPALTVLNKLDALPASGKDLPEIADADGLLVSARTGAGLPALRARIGEILFESAAGHGGELLALSAEQRSTLGEARTALERAQEICGKSRELSDSLELLALETRAALHALALLTGEITTEDLLGRIFARFCVGK